MGLGDRASRGHIEEKRGYDSRRLTDALTPFGIGRGNMPSKKCLLAIYVAICLLGEKNRCLINQLITNNFTGKTCKQLKIVLHAIDIPTFSFKRN